MANKTTPVNLNNPDDWKRFAPDELVSIQQLAEYFGVKYPFVYSRRYKQMPTIHREGKPILYLGSEITRWLNLQENRDFLKIHQRNDVLEEIQAAVPVVVASSPRPKLIIACSNDSVIITIPLSEFQSSDMFHLLRKCA